MLVSLPWLGCLSIGVPVTTLSVTALLYYGWEKPEGNHPPLATISEGGQSGWSYVAFSLGMSLSAMMFFLTGCIFALLVNKWAENEWSIRRRSWVTGLLVLLTVIYSLGLWMIGTFSWAYHGGIQCPRSATQKHFNLLFLHKLGVGLLVGGMVPYLSAIAASLTSLHMAGVVSLPRPFPTVAVVGFCGIVVFFGILVHEDTKGEMTLVMSVSQYLLIMCLLLLQLLSLYSWRGYSINIVLSKAV